MRQRRLFLSLASKSITQRNYAATAEFRSPAAQFNNHIFWMEFTKISRGWPFGYMKRCAHTARLKLVSCQSNTYRECFERHTKATTCFRAWNQLFRDNKAYTRRTWNTNISEPANRNGPLIVVCLLPAVRRQRGEKLEKCQRGWRTDIAQRQTWNGIVTFANETPIERPRHKAAQ